MPSGLRLWNEGDVKPLLLRESVTFYFIFVSAQKHWDSFKKNKNYSWQLAVLHLPAAFIQNGSSKAESSRETLRRYRRTQTTTKALEWIHNRKCQSDKRFFQHLCDTELQFRREKQAASDIWMEIFFFFFSILWKLIEVWCDDRLEWFLWPILWCVWSKISSVPHSQFYLQVVPIHGPKFKNLRKSYNLGFILSYMTFQLINNIVDK